MFKLVSFEGPDILSSPNDKYTCIFQIAGNSIIHKILCQEFPVMSTHLFNSTNIYWSPITDKHLLCHKYRDRKYSLCPQKGNYWGAFRGPLRLPGKKDKEEYSDSQVNRQVYNWNPGMPFGGARLRKTDSNTKGSMYHRNDLRSYPRSYGYLMKDSQ